MEGEDLLGRAAGGGVLHHLAQLVLAPGVAREAEEVVLDLGAGGAALAERAAGRDERHLRLAQILLEEGADLREEPRPLAGILDRREPALARRDALRVLSGEAVGGVRRLERLASHRPGDRRQGGEGLARGVARGVAPQDLDVQRERARGVAEPVAAQLGEAQGRLEVEAVGEARLEARGEVGRPVEPLEEPLERRLRLGVARREGGDVAPRRSRARRVGEPRLRDDRLLAPRVLAGGRVRRAAGELGADVGEVAPALARPVHPPERHERAAVPRDRPQHVGPGLGAPVAVEAPLGELGALPQDRGAVLRRGALDELVVHARARLRLLALDREPPHLAAHLGVARRRPGGLGRGGEGEGELAQLLLADPRHPALRGGARRRVALHARLRLEGADAAAGIGVGGEGAGRRHHGGGILAVEVRLDGREGGGVGGARRERGGEALDGGAGVAEARLDARRLHVRPRRLGRIRGGPGELGEGLRAPLRVAARAEHRGELPEEPGALLHRGRGDRLAQRVGGAGGVLEPLVEHLGPLREERGPLGALGRLGAPGQELGGVLPALGGERRPRQRRQHRGIAGAEREHAAELQRGLLVGAEVLLGDRGGAQPERGLLGGAAVEAPRHLGEQEEQLAVGAHLAGERLAAPARVGVVRAGAQRGGGGGEGAAGVVQLLGAEGGGVEEVAGALARIRLGRQLPREHLEHGRLLAGVPGRGVGGHERLRDAQRLHPLLEEPLEERRRVGARRGAEAAPLQHREGGRRGVAVPAEPVGEDLCARDLDGRSLRRPLRPRGEPGEHLGPLLRGAEPRGRLERRVEPPERLLVVRREGEGLAPERGGAVEPRRVVPQAGELRRERPALGALGARAPRLELPRQLLLLPGAGEARLEGRGRAAVVGIEREHRAPGPDRLLGLAEVAVEDLRDAAVEGLARLDVSALALRGGAVGAGELEERVGARGGALHRLAGRGARRVEGERARERPERVPRPPEPLLLHLGEPLEEADPLPRVRGPRRGQLEDLGEPRPLLRLGEERREGGRGLGAARVGAERRLEVPARARGIAEPLLGELGGAHAERRVRGLLRRGGEVPLEDAEGALEPAGVDVVLEGLERGALAGRVELEGALEGGEGALAVAEADEVHQRHLDVERDEGAAVAGGRGEAGQRVGVAAVVALLRVDPREQLERERLAGREGPGPLDALERGAPALRVVGGVELGEAQVERGGLAAVRHPPGRLVQGARLLAPRAGEGLEPLAGRGGPGRGAVERGRLDERVHGEVVLERLLDELAAEPRVLAREPLRVGAGVPGGVEHPLRLPEAAQRREAGEAAGARLVERRIEARGAGVEERPAIAPAEPLLVDAAEAQREPRRLARVRRGVRLAGERRREPRPVLPRLEDLHHRAERGRVGGLGAEELPVELLRAGHVPELRVGQARGLREERRRGRVDPGAPLVERDEVLPAGRALVEGLERLERLAVPRRGLERLEVRADQVVRDGSAQGGGHSERAGPRKAPLPRQYRVAGGGGSTPRRAETQALTGGCLHRRRGASGARRRLERVAHGRVDRVPERGRVRGVDEVGAEGDREVAQLRVVLEARAAGEDDLVRAEEPFGRGLRDAAAAVDVQVVPLPVVPVVPAEERDLHVGPSRVQVEGAVVRARAEVRALQEEADREALADVHAGEDGHRGEAARAAALRARERELLLIGGGRLEQAEVPRLEGHEHAALDVLEPGCARVLLELRRGVLAERERGHDEREGEDPLHAASTTAPRRSAGSTGR